jgi:RNA polymerase sigma-70 factor (ECF subfamily)
MSNGTETETPKNQVDQRISKESFSLEALRRGDRTEFARLVEEYSAVIYRLAYRMLNNQQDAEDVLQDTFLKALRGLKTFDGRSRLSTWLYRIAANESLMLIRRHKKGSLSLDEPLDSSTEDPDEPRQIIDWCCLPENELMSAEARKHLDQAIDTLSPNLRMVFVLRDLEGLSTAETGEVLGLTETAVKTRLSRARLHLREQLSEYFAESVSRRKIAVEGVQ